MTTLVFPQDAEDWSQAFNSALGRGVLNNDPGSHSFWGHHELQASEVEDGEVVCDWFYQKHTLEFKRISRAEKDTES